MTAIFYLNFLRGKHLLDGILDFPPSFGSLVF